MHMKKIKDDIGCGIALEVIGVLIWVFSMSIRKMKTATYDISSAVFPRICGTILLLLGLILIIGGVRRLVANKKAGEAQPAADEAPSAETANAEISNSETGDAGACEGESADAEVQNVTPLAKWGGLIRLFIVLAAFVLFIIFLPILGFIISGTLLQFVLMAVMAPASERKPVKLALYFGIAVVSAVLVDLLFVQVFRLMLPAGLLSF